MSTLTGCENEVPGFSPVNQESPFLVTLPSVSQPAAPVSTGLTFTGPLPLTPCQAAIALQMCFGVKQSWRAFGVFGSDPLVTSEKVWGPTLWGSVWLTTASSSPATTVLGATKRSPCLPSLM